MANIRQLIQKAIAEFGSEARLAKAAGVTQPAINEAKQKGRVGHRLALGISRATEGRISKHDLRPDIWPRQDAAE
jgi:DNA-binding transcriptional regulator YdaS (Cro superfamily)